MTSTRPIAKVGETVITFWDRKTRLEVLEVRSWAGCPSGVMVRLNWTGPEWIDAWKVKKVTP